MRAASALVAIATLGVGAIAYSAAHAACSVFDRHPCAPTVCSVFRRGPCIPEYDSPIGQDLRLTIDSAAVQRAGTNESTDGRELNTLADLFAALRACWVPPPESESRPGMEMSVRFAFKRTGELIATPRVTFVTPDATREVRERYHESITAAFERCAPLAFSQGLGGAIAGRPIAIRFVDSRKPEQP